MTNYFIGVINGNKAEGYLASNGEVFTARSGAGAAASAKNKGYIPEGDYTIDSKEAVNGKIETSIVDPKNPKHRHKKFRIVGNGPRNAGTDPNETYTALDGTTKNRPLVNDPRHPGETRNKLLSHFDGGPRGTEGCIGYDSLGAESALSTSVDKGDTGLKVFYVKDQKQAKTLADMYAKPPQDFHDRHPKWATGEVSDIKNGAKVVEGEPSVVHGEKQYQAVHKDHAHSGGGQVAEGNSTIKVGPQQKDMAGIDHSTTDKSAVATGEPSIEMAH